MDREEVIRALECCLIDGWETCHNCPYYCGNCYECTTRMKSDALAILKAQEPRVMTLEEVKSLERDAVVWYEHRGVNKQRPRIVDQVYDSGVIFTDGGHWRFNADAYGKNFRLWTSRPDEKRRAETPWN